MNKYEIECKYYYYETSEYGTETIVARSEAAALKKFANQRNISHLKITNYGHDTWWEGDWLVKIKNVKKIS